MNEGKSADMIEGRETVASDVLVPAQEAAVPLETVALALDQDAEPDPDTIVLELADLLPDASGEVVLFAEEDFPVNIVANEGITEAGVAAEHVTATGVDVTGLHFYSFEGGLTLYSSANVHVINDVTLG